MTPRILSLTALMFLIVGTVSRSQEVERRDKATLKLVTYNVADLIGPREDKQAEKSTPEKKGTNADPSPVPEQLLDLIVKSVHPSSWGALGGSGTIQFFPLGMCVVINQTDEVHEEIQALLAALRRLQEVEVSVELKVITISDEGLRALAGFLEVFPEGQEKRPLAFLDDKQLRDFFEKAQGDRALNVMQAPRITMGDAEHSGINVGDQQRLLTGVEVACEHGKIVARPKYEVFSTNGVRCDLVPTVTSDRKQVKFAVNFEMASLESMEAIPLSLPVSRQRPDGTDEIVRVKYTLEHAKIDKRCIDQTILITNGHTAVLYCGSSKTKESVPVVSRIPQVNRLFRNAGSERVTHLLVLVTPRILTSGVVETRPVQTEPIPRP